MIERHSLRKAISRYLDTFPVTALLGARQVGKTTLANAITADYYLDLENPRDLARLDEPQTTLENLRGLVVIDEIQRRPDLFPLLRYMVDREPGRRFLILGSASRDLIRQGSESLAGRIGFLEVGGFTLEEACPAGENWHTLWIRGGFPRSFLARDDDSSFLWRNQFIQTFLERDIPQLGIQIPSRTLGRFWTMLSHYHGQLLNYRELANSFGVSDMTARRYLEILEGTFMVRLLKPWHANIGKRLVKSPKLYLRDSGMFHALQDLRDADALNVSPKLGASWEGFALEQAIRRWKIETPWFYRTQAGAELDLYWESGGSRFGVELKYADAPKLTPSMRNALTDLKLDQLTVIYPGDVHYELGDKVRVVPLAALSDGN